MVVSVEGHASVRGSMAMEIYGLFVYFRNWRCWILDSLRIHLLSKLGILCS